MITTYSYDAAGNRTRLNVDGALTTYAYDAANRLRRSQEVSGITTYTFDANGNQRSIRAPASGVTGEWEKMCGTGFASANGEWT